MKKAEEQLRDVERNIEKNWNSSSLTDADKKDMLEVFSIYSNSTVNKASFTDLQWQGGQVDEQDEKVTRGLSEDLSLWSEGRSIASGQDYSRTIV